MWKGELEASKDETPVLRLGEADARGLCFCDKCIAWDTTQPWEDNSDDVHIFEPIDDLPFGEAWHISSYERFKSMTDMSVVTPSIVGPYYPRNTTDRYVRFWNLIHERATKIAPNVITTAYVYQNYFVSPTKPVSLSSNMHLSFVPWSGFFFPRPVKEQQWVKDQWLGWQETGASMSYRPNYFHDGYVMPYVFTRQFADMFRFIEENGAVGTSFDSLKGQWATQGTTLYLLMRLHTRTEKSVNELLLEYYEAFGPAADYVKSYFDYWEAYTTNNQFRWDEIASKSYGGEGRSLLDWRRWNAYARYVHELFPPESFERAQTILDSAASVVPEDSDNEYTRRVQFLQKGLDHARKSAALASQFDDEEVSAEEREQANKELVEFRHRAEGWFISNLTHAVRQESNSWDFKPGYIGE